ncbi:RidA family protein [Pontivivens ytuae]|uniref:RidA family protein n=1 Tax=Pontivivens ytuae TaxID=2789856 RepID=A0A7S9LUZ3_9RHOB|nr:RidA family protein [Pontivivens ytuae]QPH55465.1 RidA family protein [Pontivivens ytuae]
MSVDDRLKELGIELPDAPAPAANYVPTVRTGNLLYVSGQVPIQNGALVTGQLGAGFSVEDGQAAARLCAISLIAQVKKAVGDLETVRVVKLNGFVNATGDFGEHPAVVNGASDLMVEIFGEKGRHARSAVGSSSLPFGVAVEVEGIFEIA